MAHAFSQAPNLNVYIIYTRNLNLLYLFSCPFAPSGGIASETFKKLLTLNSKLLLFIPFFTNYFFGDII